MRVKFYLKRPESKEQTTIFARITYDGVRAKYYLPESINPDNWSTATQRAKISKKWPEHLEFNERLDDIEKYIRTTVRRFHLDNNAYPTWEKLKSILDFEIKNIGVQQKVTFFQFLDTLIISTQNGTRLHPKTQKPLAPGTAKTYQTAKNILLDFQTKTGYKVEFDSVTVGFYKLFLSYCYSKKYKANYIGKIIKKLKTVMSEATDEGHNRNLDFKKKSFASIAEPVDNISLTEIERQLLADVDLSEKPHLDKVRDMFVIGCYTGLRYSDYSAIDANKIKGGSIIVEQTKTGGKIVIPVHPKVQGIVSKYNGTLPISISNQKTNEYLKEICRTIKPFKEFEEITSTVGGVVTKQKIQRCELISTHTARRTFCTLEYLAGTPAITIMAISGHKSEKEFLKYIKVDSNEHAELLKDIWSKREKALEVINFP